MKCANCEKDAVYIYRSTLKTEILYCETHLPSFLENRKRAGLLPTTEEFKTAKEEGESTLGVSINTPVVELEKTPTPTPSKKPTKKPATKNDTDS